MLSAQGLYGDYVNPKLAAYLKALGLDRSYVRAEDTYLFDESGIAVLDMVGGFGAGLFGHYHPEIKQALIDALEEGIPQQAQASAQREAGLLAQTLNALVGGRTGYRAIFGSTGAECVEAALKHAYLVHCDSIQRKYDRIRNLNADEFALIEDGAYGALSLPPGVGSSVALRDAIDDHNQAALEKCVRRPIAIALKGAFHGKSTSALKVTHGEWFRAPFENLSTIETRFIDPHAPDELRQIVDDEQVNFQYLVVFQGQAFVHTLEVSRAMAFILEPILGEGGVYPIPDESMRTFAEIHTDLKFPFIIDEIQTGCGRTGNMFSFQQTPLAEIEPDYITLGKALGGGVAKIGVTLVRNDVYRRRFGLIHSSTFAEDGLACRTARATLDLLLKNGGERLEHANRVADYMHFRLDELRRRHPQTVSEIRGKGLMMGIEFGLNGNFSPFLSVSAQKSILPILIASYLLHYHKIRLMPPLGCVEVEAAQAPRSPVLRIQPPLTITREDIDRLVLALDEVLTVIERNNEYCLLAHLWGEDLTAEERQNPRQFYPQAGEPEGGPDYDLRVGFVLHPGDIRHIVSHFMPSLNAYGWDVNLVSGWWRAVAPFVSPIDMHRATVRSRGRRVAVDLVLIPILPENMIPETAPERREIADKVAAAVRLAARGRDGDLPAAIIGLGGYTSIITEGGRTLPDCGVPITTGNTYTVGLILEAIECAARKKDIDLASCTVAVVGACGDIGLVLSQRLAPKSGKLILVGRPGRSGALRLKYARRTCAAEINRALDDAQENRSCEVLPLKIHPRTNGEPDPAGPDNAVPFPKWHPSQDAGEIANGGAAGTAREDNGTSGAASPRLEISTDIDVIRDANVVVVATNSADLELIKPHMLKPGAVVCCVSVPSNVSFDLVAARPDCFVYSGGLAKLPEGSEINFVGLPSGGLAWACLAETIFLGLAGAKHSVGRGRVRPYQIPSIVALARQYGFSMGPLRTIAEAESGDWRGMTGAKDVVA
jgi:acetylornithine/succinyldiaminopimelate/putrescine aminotransferase/predicted amino acid dehydrogenase